MPSLSLSQHLFSSVTQGLFKERGRGFQTVACTPELRDTADLTALEEASFFAVSPERRQGGDLPVKELFYRLPSGRFAVGRMDDARIDSLGRDGNYCAHQLVVSAEHLEAIGWQPFALLDAAPWCGVADDLTPRLLEPCSLSSATVADPASASAASSMKLDQQLLGRVAAALSEADGRTVLIVGNEARTRSVIRALFAVLPSRERREITFCTHFFEGNPYRSLFKVASVATRGEAPAAGDTDAYRVVDHERVGTPPALPYGIWIEDALKGGRWIEVSAVHGILDRFRQGQPVPEADFPPPAPAWAAALQYCEPDAFARALLGRPLLLAGVLDHLPKREALAERLLRQYAPPELCGPDGTIAVTALRAAAKPKHWMGWLKRHREEPLLGPYLEELEPAWKKLAANLPWPRRS